uniref:Putative transcription factor TFIIB zinc-binding motif n=1 Tax=viral metagenome TaxID=1070528 RepID=A0A6H2A4V1_9ZZZZ
MQPNPNNPRCPECGTRSQRWGTRARKKLGKALRFKCPECGITFFLDEDKDPERP